MTARLTRFALFGLMLLIGSSTVQSQESVPAQAEQIVVMAETYELLEIVEDELLVLEVRLGNTSSGHGLIAYPNQGDILLPLAELSSVLELSITVDPHAGRADGWIVDESRIFAIDIPNRTLTVNGNLSPLPNKALAVDDNDIYIRSDLMSTWLPLDLDLNLSRMHVKISPREILPFQSRLRRDEQRSVWMASKGRGVLDYPQHVAPYRIWSWPIVDATYGITSNRFGDSHRLSLQSNSDLGGLSSNVFLSHTRSNDLSYTASRLKAGRWDPQGGLLGPAGATRYEFGDLFISRIPMISNRIQGTGASISNQSLYRSREFDTTDVQGDAPAGWDAELYVNGALFDFMTIPEDGRYLFSNVPLTVGNNVFRTVVYGPRGESREFVEHANISPQMSDLRQLKYTATLVRDGGSLLGTGNDTPPGVEKPWNQQLELAYSLSPHHALVGNIARVKIDQRQEMFNSLTSHHSLGRFYLENILARSTRGGKAYSLGLQTRLKDQNIVLRRTINDDYRAEAQSSQSYVREYSNLRTSGNLMDSRHRSMSYSLSATEKKYAEDDLLAERDYQFQLSTGLHKLLLSHRLSYRDREFQDYDSRAWMGTQLFRSWLGPISVRGDLNYELAPGRLRSASATLNFFRLENFQATARASYAFKDQYGPRSVGLDFTRLFKTFTLGCNFTYYNTTGTTMGLTIGTFLARDIRANQWASAHRPMSNRAIASVCAFVDMNGNRLFDEGDEALEGVGFQKLNAWKNILTNSDGYAFLPGLLVHSEQVIELDLTTVVDPFLIPVEKGVAVVGHPGSIIDVEFPFTYAGEIEGIIVDATKPKHPIRHVGLELVNSVGERVGSTVGEFDGFYYFPEIMPGEYEIRVIPRTVNTRVYEIPEPIPISIPSLGGFIYGPDIVFERHFMEKKPEILVQNAEAGLSPGVVKSDEMEITVAVEGPEVSTIESENSETSINITVPTPTAAQVPVILNPLRIRSVDSVARVRNRELAADTQCTRK